MSDTSISASDWVKGISFSVLASVIGGASKLAIRKSWLMQEASGAIHNNSVTRNISYVPLLNEQSAADTDSSIKDVGDYLMPPPDSEYPATTPTPKRQYSSLCMAYLLRLSGMIGMTFLNPLACVLAMAYASPSVLAPFSGLTLVWIVLLARPTLGEQPTKQQLAGAALIVAGEVIVAVFGDHTNEESSTSQSVLASYLYPPFVVFMAVMFLWMLLLLYWIKYEKCPLVKRFAWGVAGGSVTGFQNFIKDALTIVKYVQSHSDATYPRFLWLLVVFAILSAFLGLVLLAACMKRYDATYSSTMFVGSFVISASIMSAVHYNTFRNLESAVNWSMYPTGLAVLVGGVWVLLHDDKHRDAVDETPPSNITREAVSSSTRVGCEPLIVGDDDDVDSYYEDCLEMI
jgi:drug/metabolite transporter (DMT)-like permease